MNEVLLRVAREMKRFYGGFSKIEALRAIDRTGWCRSEAAILQANSSARRSSLFRCVLEVWGVEIGGSARDVSPVGSQVLLWPLSMLLLLLRDIFAR